MLINRFNIVMVCPPPRCRLQSRRFQQPPLPLRGPSAARGPPRDGPEPRGGWGLGRGGWGRPRSLSGARGEPGGARGTRAEFASRMQPAGGSRPRGGELGGSGREHRGAAKAEAGCWGSHGCHSGCPARGARLPPLPETRPAAFWGASVTRRGWRVGGRQGKEFRCLHFFVVVVLSGTFVAHRDYLPSFNSAARSFG